MDFLKKHWTTLLGVVFFLAAFGYLLKISWSSDWLTDTVKITIGLVFSGALLTAGTQFILKQSKQLGQFIAGAGVAVFSTTVAFAGILYELWAPMTVFVLMIAVTLISTIFSYRYDLRILMNTALVGGLIAPLLMRPETDTVFTLFLYLLVLNVAYFFVAIHKRWDELYAVMFGGTWLLYSVYWLHFDPTVESVWSLPMRYAVAAFLFYIVALAWAAWTTRKAFDGLNLYLGLINGLLFSVWAIAIIGKLSEASVSASSLLLLLVGVVYIVVAASMYFVNRELKLPVIIYSIGGMLLSIIAASQFLQDFTYASVMQVFLWTFVATLLAYVSRWRNYMPLFWASQAVWACILIYWFATTWGEYHGIWFGVYIPFLNNGALAWMLLAALGFYYSLRSKEGWNYVFAILSHLIVGGLLTVQIENIWTSYDLNPSWESLSLSISWGVYALLLFVWGAYTQTTLYKVFGSVVLVFVAIKTIFFDLTGSETFYKVIALMVLGLISFAITFINNRWKIAAKEPVVETVKDDN